MTTFLDYKDIFSAMQSGKLELQGQFLNSSNYTFLVQVIHKSLQFITVYKPSRGERPLWDFPDGTLAKREVSAYMVSEALGWHLVPPTVYRNQAPLGPGSLQLYIEHDPEYHYFNFNDSDKQRLRPIVTFDLLVNNADRKGSHILNDEQGHFWLIDHGLCFHEEDKLRTVLWDFAGEEIPVPLLDDLQDFLEELENKGTIYQQLQTRLYESEVTALAERARSILDNRYFPFPSEDHRPYPWPPI